MATCCQRGRSRARAHHPRVPQPFVDTLAIQKLPLLVGFELLLQGQQLGEWRIRIGLLAAAFVRGTPGPRRTIVVTIAVAARPIGTLAARRALVPLTIWTITVLALGAVGALRTRLLAVRTTLTVLPIAITAMPRTAFAFAVGRCRGCIADRTLSLCRNSRLSGGLSIGRGSLLLRSWTITGTAAALAGFAAVAHA